MLNRRLTVALTALAAASPLCLGQVHASPLEDYNLIVFEDMTTTSNVQGRAFIGGNLDAGQFATQIPTPLTFTDSLLVGGDLVGGIITVDKGNARIGGNINNTATLTLQGNGPTSRDAFITGSNLGTINTNGSVTLGGSAGNINNASSITPNDTPAPTAPDIADIRNELEALSAFAASITADTAVTVNGNQRIFNVGNPLDKLAVFEIDGSLLSTQNISFDMTGLDPDETVLINVAGTDIDIDQVNFLGGFGTGTLAESRVLFNFFEATSIDITRTTVGALLAPLAHVTNTVNLEGTLVAKSFTQNGEVHLETFTGTIPEPASLALLAAGLTLTARRRRN